MAKLTSELILTTSLAIVDEEGLDALTMRTLGDRLGVSAMAVYRHFENKKAIVAQLMGRVISEYQPTQHDTEQWEDWMRETFGRIRKALLAHPGVIPLAGSHVGLDESSLKVVEDTLQAFLNAGFDGKTSVQMLMTLVNYTIGSATIENRAAQTAKEIADLSQMTDLVGAVANWYKRSMTEGMPALVSHSQYLASYPSEYYFQSGLDRILRDCATELDS